MAFDKYNRFVVRSSDISCWGIILLVGLFWLATLADYLFRLGWGWDIKGIWVAPIIIGVALLIRKLGRIIAGVGELN